MSLYFKERIDEHKKKEDPLKDKITFIYPWIIEIPPLANGENDENGVISFGEMFATTYLFKSEMWCLELTREKIRIGSFYAFTNDVEDDDDGPVRYKLWYGSCHLSYNLYYDNDMRILLYSSSRIQLNNTNKDAFKTPVGFMARMAEAYDQRKIAKIVLLIEIQLPAKYFYQPFERPLTLNGVVCDSYPSNVENNYLFASFKKSDYVIKCPDGEMLCRRIILNLASKFFKKHFKTSNKLELPVDHLIDVVKPIIIFLHTRCWKLPKVCDANYAKRLVIAIEYFAPERIWEIRAGVDKSLSKKFVDEYHDFDSILQWTSLVTRYIYLHNLNSIIVTVVADKFYYKWQQTFPENARNFQNPLFLDIFGSEEQEDIFSRIDDIYWGSYFTNVILP